MCFASKAPERIAKQQRADEVARQQRIASGMTQIDGAFSGFNDDFYNKIKQNYVNYATPELDRQTGQARDNLIYALSRNGNLDSSAFIKKNNDLQHEADTARIGIADTGLNQANAMRGNVENTRSGVVAELNATSNSDAATATAMRQANNLNVPQGYTPLGNLFANFAGTLGQIGSSAGTNYGGFVGGGRGLFSPSSGAQRVVGG